MIKDSRKKPVPLVAFLASVGIFLLTGQTANSPLTPFLCPVVLLMLISGNILLFQTMGIIFEFLTSDSDEEL